MLMLAPLELPPPPLLLGLGLGLLRLLLGLLLGQLRMPLMELLLGLLLAFVLLLGVALGLDSARAADWSAALGGTGMALGEADADGAALGPAGTPACRAWS
ncbi:hypothetical protein ABH930_004551 [Kitasatospora sp. GAS204A]|uniref:hypothetical protein n=1 Tax=unclassified Kitasatospora TaxID=2633591 RepID=UPI0024740184|nr:hypothetical protein [Kitasatospora sp. GAS204B]MDH6119790.1 hypothetical protein [Kitasatospora sp. GAS204B]